MSSKREQGPDTGEEETDEVIPAAAESSEPTADAPDDAEASAADVVEAETPEAEALDSEALDAGTPDAVEGSTAAVAGPESEEPVAPGPDEEQPAGEESGPVEPDPVEPDAADSDPVEPDAVDSDPLEPDAVDSDPVEPDPAEPDAVESDPVESGDDVAGTPPVSRGERLRRLLVRPSRSQIVVAALLAILGFAAVTQVQNTQDDDTTEGVREEELIEIFNGLAGTSERARSEINRLENTRRELQIDASARQAAIEQAEQRLATLNMLAGLVPVNGPGLRITVTEQAGRISIDSLLDMLQELRTAGAEAMEINGIVRVVASSSFSDEDGVIHMDGQPLRSPYVVEVIGEPQTLRDGLEFRSGPLVSLEKENAEVDIQPLDSVEIETVRDLPQPEFADPAEGQ